MSFGLRDLNTFVTCWLLQASLNPNSVRRSWDDVDERSYNSSM